MRSSDADDADISGMGILQEDECIVARWRLDKLIGDHVPRNGRFHFLKISRDVHPRAIDAVVFSAVIALEWMSCEKDPWVGYLRLEELHRRGDLDVPDQGHGRDFVFEEVVGESLCENGVDSSLVDGGVAESQRFRKRDLDRIDSVPTFGKREDQRAVFRPFVGHEVIIRPLKGAHLTITRTERSHRYFDDPTVDVGVEVIGI